MSRPLYRRCGAGAPLLLLQDDERAFFRGFRFAPTVPAADGSHLQRVWDSRLAVPTLLFTNTGENLYAATNRCRALRPDFAYAELEGDTHDIIDEQPAAWTRTIDNFLRLRAGPGPS